jgi:hypothetical protein
VLVELPMERRIVQVVVAVLVQLVRLHLCLETAARVLHLL